MNYINNIKKLLVANQQIAFENTEMRNKDLAELLGKSPQTTIKIREGLNKNLEKFGYTPEFVQEADKNHGWFFIDLPDLDVDTIKEVMDNNCKYRKLCEITIEHVLFRFYGGAPKHMHPMLNKIAMYSKEYHDKVQRILMISTYPMNFIYEVANGQLREGDSYTSIEEVNHIFDGMMQKLVSSRTNDNGVRRVEIIEEMYKYNTSINKLAKKYGVTYSRIAAILYNAERVSKTGEFFVLINALNDNTRHGYININDIIKDIERRKEEEAKHRSEFKVINNDTPLDELGLSVRSYNCLKRAGMENFGDVVFTFLPCINGEEEELPRIRNFGQKCYDEVKKLIETTLNVGGVCLDEEI